MKHFNQLTTVKYIQRCQEKYDYGYDYSKVIYTGCSNEVIITCIKHGDFRLRASNHLNKGTQCPKCRIILPFDFYIPSIRTAIEYQGKQHYEPVCFGGCSVESSLKVFEMNKSHDAIKRKYCQENNINLIKIPYTEILSISEILLNIY